ncbi:MAG: CDP-diacylglycerol--glycerol-3-phosphate 3-phosphatidyltransferase [Clostridia bacterium]|nr:CDP-diacylglycerol--glycerol-3-phosphate 3-phosphatidyltransferase [Clostridia bacterium]
MNLPNKLTVARIIMTPIYLAAMMIDFKFHYLVAAVIFIIASITDFVDGKLARQNNQVTTFGKLCDPLADKMLTTAALLAFMDMEICNIWIVMIILTREFLVTSFRLVASAQGVVIAANIWGKLKTVSQMVVSIAIMLAIHFVNAYSLDFETFALVSNVLLGITALLTVVSGVKYIADGIRVIDFSK